MNKLAHSLPFEFFPTDVVLLRTNFYDFRFLNQSYQTFVQVLLSLHADIPGKDFLPVFFEFGPFAHLQFLPFELLELFDILVYFEQF